MKYKKEINWLLKEKYNGQASLAFQKDVLRLKRGEPLAYVIGWTPFLDCKIDLSFRPLIPRAETEFWVERAINKIKKEAGKKRIMCLDIFAGSGCIGVAAMKHIPNVTVDFGEKDPNCLKQVKRNLNINGVNARRGRVIKSDIFSKILYQYDYIFANPPYIAREKKNLVAKSVLDFEPHRALFAGEKGMLYITRFLRAAHAHLKKNGTIFLEFDSWQKKSIEKEAKTLGYTRTIFLKDQYGKWRIAVLES